MQFLVSSPGAAREVTAELRKRRHILGLKLPLCLLGPCLAVPQHHPGSRMWRGDDKEAENYLSMLWHKRANPLFLLWRISNMADCLLEVCPMASPRISACLVFEDSCKLRGHKPSAAETHAVRHVYVPPPVCYGKKPRRACSASQSRPALCTEAPVPSSAWQCWPHWTKPAGGQKGLASSRVLPLSCICPGFELPESTEKKES